MQYHFFFDLAAFLLFFGSAAASVSEGCGSGLCSMRRTLVRVLAGQCSC